jgi:hypothetical protein
MRDPLRVEFHASRSTGLTQEAFGKLYKEAAIWEIYRARGRPGRPAELGGCLWGEGGLGRVPARSPLFGARVSGFKPSRSYRPNSPNHAVAQIDQDCLMERVLRNARRGGGGHISVNPSFTVRTPARRTGASGGGAPQF